MPLQNAGAAEVVRVVNSLYQGAAAAEGAAVKVVADERSNSVLIGGEQSQRLRLRALIAHLDTPLEAGGDTRVRYLHYADAEKLAPKLKEQITGIAQTTGGGGAAGAGGAQGGSPIAQAEKNAMVWADPTNNALVITAPPKIMRAVMDIIDKLDIRRPQVLVEAIIAEVDEDKDAELGINWAAFSNGTNIPAGSLRQPGRRHQHRRPRRRHPEPGQCHDHASCRAPRSASGASPARASISPPCSAPSAATPTPTSSRRLRR